jgi:hypothetical protein
MSVSIFNRFSRFLAVALRPRLVNTAVFALLFTISSFVYDSGLRRIGFPFPFFSAIPHSCPLLSPGCTPYTPLVGLVSYSNLILDIVVCYVVGSLLISAVTLRREWFSS